MNFRRLKSREKVLGKSADQRDTVSVSLWFVGRDYADWKVARVKLLFFVAACPNLLSIYSETTRQIFFHYE